MAATRVVEGGASTQRGAWCAGHQRDARGAKGEAGAALLRSCDDSATRGMWARNTRQMGTRGRGRVSRAGRMGHLFCDVSRAVSRCPNSERYVPGKWQGFRIQIRGGSKARKHARATPRHHACKDQEAAHNGALVGVHVRAKALQGATRERARWRVAKTDQVGDAGETRPQKLFL